MTGWRAFLGKELREIRRTWRAWVIPGLVALFAVTGPPIARWTRELLSSMVGDQASAIPLPDPTYVAAYQQWTKNLGQIVLFAVIVTLGGSVSGERRSGTATLVLTKPVSRAAFVLAKIAANTVFVAASVIGGALLTWVVTRLLFSEAPVGPLAGATAAWLLVGGLFVSLLVLASAALDSAAGASGLGFAAYLVLAIAGAWGPLARWTPAGLLSAPDRIAGGTDAALLWPILTGFVLVGVLAVAAVAVFRRREL